mmetsp:Transcript_6410/g.14739  ORF Transcript_6410/g.14739 Transcript_6410/m.14739 type:complete len:96 (+) Transcript_6410:39-326(+)
MGDIWVHPRHGGLQEMILKDMKWTAKAIQRKRALEAEAGKEVRVIQTVPKPAGVGEGKAKMDTAPLLKSQNGSLLPNNVSCGPTVYYTGCGRYRR